MVREGGTRASRAPAGVTELSLEELQPQPPGTISPQPPRRQESPHVHAQPYAQAGVWVVLCFGPSTTRPAAPHSIRTTLFLLQHPSPLHPAFPAASPCQIPLGRSGPRTGPGQLLPS